MDIVCDRTDHRSEESYLDRVAGGARESIDHRPREECREHSPYNRLHQGTCMCFCLHILISYLLGYFVNIPCTHRDDERVTPFLQESVTDLVE